MRLTSSVGQFQQQQMMSAVQGLTKQQWQQQGIRTCLGCSSGSSSGSSSRSSCSNIPGGVMSLASRQDLTEIPGFLNGFLSKALAMTP
jgi:hypothetical protein